MGYLPTQSKNSSQAEKTLAVRLLKARKACSLSSKQEAALENLAQGAAQHLVDIIIELGYLPTQSKNSTLEEKQLAVRLIKACNAGSLSLKQEVALGKLAEGVAEVGHVAGLQALHEAGLRPLLEAEARIAKAEELMQQVRGFGRCPKENERCSLAERQAARRRLVGKLRWARKTKLLSPEQEAERQVLQQAWGVAGLRKAWEARKLQAEAVRIDKAEEMMQEVRGFGRYPMESRQDVRERQLADKLRKARKAKRFSPAQEAELQALQQAARERRLAQNLRKARKEKLLSAEQESELQVFQQAEMDSRAAARISEAQRPLDPMERFAGESESRITPQGKGRQKEYNAASYQKNKARLVAKQKEYNATPHGKAKRKEYEVTPHGKTKRKEAQVMYGTTPHGKATRKEYEATPHGKATQKEY